MRKIAAGSHLSCFEEKDAPLELLPTTMGPNIPLPLLRGSLGGPRDEFPTTADLSRSLRRSLRAFSERKRARGPLPCPSTDPSPFPLPSDIWSMPPQEAIPKSHANMCLVAKEKAGA